MAETTRTPVASYAKKNAVICWLLWSARSLWLTRPQPWLRCMWTQEEALQGLRLLKVWWCPSFPLSPGSWASPRLGLDSVM